MDPEAPTATFPRGRIAAYEPSVGDGVCGSSVTGFVLYTLEKLQQSAYAVITPAVSE
jgi:hypothetical protein